MEPVVFTEIDGLLLTGGGDIIPDCFNQECHPTLKNIDKARDTLEILLFKQALEADIPVFGICRGIQIMNVAGGGNLYQDISSEFPGNTLPHEKVKGCDSQHSIVIESGSHLNEIVDGHRALVNSAHHQALNEVGEGFVVTAHTEDCVVEAMEHPSKRFVIGVQYHPERMLTDPELCQHALKLFEAFINAAR